jgi:opacity protein-like surface antigen
MASVRSHQAARRALLAAIFLLPGSAGAAFDIGGAIHLRGGEMILHDDKQVFGQSGSPNTDVSLDRHSQSAFGFSWELRLPFGWSVGTEFLRYKNEFTPTSSPSARGLAQTDAFLVTAKKYFLPEKMFRPYVGWGAGAGVTENSNQSTGGTINDSNINPVFHAMAGAEWRFDNNLSLLLETRYLVFSIESQKTDYNPTGLGAFIGMGMHW